MDDGEHGSGITLVISGASGVVGTGIRPFLREVAKLRLIARSAPPDLSRSETWIKADIRDAAAMKDAMSGADAVLHLACVHGHRISFEDTLDTNYRGTIALYDAAVSAGVSQLIFASSNHGWGFHKAGSPPLPLAAEVAPDGWYGISKIWGEAVTAHYAHAFGLSGVSLRIGHANDHVPTPREGRMWVSFRDLASLVALIVKTPEPGHRALWATAVCPEPFFDNAETLRLGWTPTDLPGRPRQPAPDVLPDGDIGGEFAKANRSLKA